MPQVSVITPAFNAARFIGETMGSVQTQSLRDWEMLVADDCSTDDTCRIVAERAAQDPRIRLLRQDRNSGPAATRNRALAQANGRYVAFLDSDDLWMPEKLERQVDFMTRTDCAVSYTWFRRISEDGATLGRIIESPASLTYRQALKNAAIANLTSMVDTARTGPIRINEAGYRAHDYILWLSLLRQGHKALCLQEDLARYRSVIGSISSPPARSAYWVWRIYRDIEKLSLPYAAWCLANYAGHALLKRRVF